MSNAEVTGPDLGVRALCGKEERVYSISCIFCAWLSMSDCVSLKIKQPSSNGNLFSKS